MPAAAARHPRPRAAEASVRGRAVVLLTVAAPISWGVLYYAYAVLAPGLQAELGLSAAVVSGAFTVALLTGAVAQPIVARAIERHSVRAVMASGTLVGTVGYAALAASRS